MNTEREIEIEAQIPDIEIITSVIDLYTIITELTFPVGSFRLRIPIYSWYYRSLF